MALSDLEAPSHDKGPCVFALSGSACKFYNVWCGIIVLSASSYCAWYISRAGRTVFHVSLIRLTLAGLAASTEQRRAAQQGHSPPTNPSTTSPQPSRLPPRVAARHSDGAELNRAEMLQSVTKV